MPDETDMTSGIDPTEQPIPTNESEVSRPTDQPLESRNPPYRPSQTSSDALDEAIRRATGEAPPEKPETKDEGEEGEQARAGEAKVSTEKESSEALDAALKARDEKAPAKPEDKAPAKPEDKAPDKATDKEEPKDKLSEVQLPSHAKAASQQAFATVKALAREEISRLQKELEEIKAKVPGPDVKTVTPELEKELQELREFKAANDYAGTTEFKSLYVAPLEQANVVIAEKLKAAGFSDEQIATARDKIGFDKLDWEEVFKAVPPQVRLTLQAAILNREQLAEKQRKAFDEAKARPKEFAAKQAEAAKKAAVQEVADSKEAAETFVSAVDWMKEAEIPANASAEDRKRITEANTFAKEQRGRLTAFLADRSPRMFGTLAAAAVSAFHYRRQADQFKARAEAAEEELAKIKKSTSTARVAKTAQPTTPAAPARRSILMDGNEALDALRDEATSKSS